MEPLPNESSAAGLEPAVAKNCEGVEAAPQDEAWADGAWRDELSARLNRYRARRKAPPPRYPSLRLPFDSAEASGRVQTPEPPIPPIIDAGAHALALDEFHNHPSMAEPAMQPIAVESDDPRLSSRPVPRASAKIIEFPGFAWGPPAAPPDQLAEPVIDRPRILEVPEVEPIPPALGGITIETVDEKLPDKRLGIEIPLQGASLSRRLAASMVDGIIIAAASALFGFIFWKVAGFRPPRLQLIGLGAGVPALFWAAYQYLLIVYSGTTPGLRLLRLQLARFDGTAANRRLRRWRVLAAWLSAASLGMGYVWAFLDEDVLCWHDRITHTHLAPRK